jgi:hypothetical protein
MAPDRVWAEVELPADVDWQKEADASKTGDIRERIPEGGHYRFKTNKMQGGAWLIGGAIRVKRVLTNDEVGQILKDAGMESEAQAERSPAADEWRAYRENTKGWAPGPNAGWKRLDGSEAGPDALEEFAKQVGKTKEELRADLDDAQKQVEEYLEERRKRFEQRLGRCYELSGRFVMDNGEAVLVHGTIQGEGHPPNPHAWVKFSDGKVYDPVMDSVMSGEDYAEKMNAVEHVTFARHEMTERVLKHKHWGPWDG